MRWAAFWAVHGIGSVHTVVGLKEDARDFHHLTGHYQCGRADSSREMPHGRLDLLRGQRPGGDELVQDLG
jgi:hypothetical protein